jgi:hypothetical protein
MSNSHQELPAKQLKAYRKPRLRILGDLRTLTLGGSPGANDSGASRIRNPAVHIPQPGGYYPPEFYPRPTGAPAPSGEGSDDSSQP